MRILRLLPVLVVFAVTTMYGQTTVTYDCATIGGTYCSGPLLDPGPGLSAAFTNSTMNIPALCGAGQFVSEVRPRIDVTHPFVGDLEILAQTPNFAFGTLVSRPPGGSGSCASDNILATFQDGAPPFACSPTPPANGTDPVAGASSLQQLTQFARTGVWTLQIGDYVGGNAGFLNGWSLTFVCSPLNVLTITASDPTGTEGSDPIVFTVTRSGVPALQLIVPITYTGTAAMSADYNAGGVIIPAGASSATITITPFSDAVSEPSETIIATIDPSPEWVVGSPSSATATILDASPNAVPTLSPLGIVIAVLLLGAAALVVLRGGGS